MKLLNFLKIEIAQVMRSMHASYKSAPPEMQKGARNIVVIAILLAAGFKAYDDGHDYFEQKHRAEEVAKGPHVKTAVAQMTPGSRAIELTGEAKPYAAVTLYARVSGFLKDVRVDKGDIVKKGQVLAIIESPETDDTLRAAEADARTKRSLSDRTQKLLKRDLVSPQEAENEAAAADVAEARYESAKLAKSYETLRAPFSGVVTSRFADAGALVQSAQNSQTSAIPIVALSEVNKLRVYVYIDQRQAHSVTKGTVAHVSLTERPDLKLTGHVERVTGALDEKTRMLLAEIDLDNDSGDIVAGSLVQVSLDLKQAPGVSIPSEALVLRDGKTFVPVISAENKVVYAPVKIADDDGKFVVIQTGLEAGQTVALNLGNTVADHGNVRPMPLETTPPRAPSSTHQAAK